MNFSKMDVQGIQTTHAHWPFLLACMTAEPLGRQTEWILSGNNCQLSRIVGYVSTFL